MRIWIASIGLGLGLLFAPGCAVNPVTGERELAFIGEGQEIAMGTQAYQPTKQAQGGPYQTMPALTRYVSEVGQKIVAVSDRPELPYEFEVLNNPVPNAWALPGGKIAINRGLLTVLDNEAELAAVLAHEVVHAAARHGAQRVERAQVGGALATVGLVGLGAALEDSENRDMLMGLAHTSAGLGLTLITQRYSRDAEFEADRYGIEYMAEAGYDPQGSVSLQEKFLALSQGRSSGFFERLFASHPPSADRVAANKDMAAQYPAGGHLGREAYQKAIEPLKEAQPAYEEYQQGVEALQSGRPERAIEIARSAQRKLPAEGLFYALESKAQRQMDLPNDALSSIEMAINRNDRFFAFHLMRAQLLEEMGRTDAARQSYARSQSLLPTAESTAALGFIALENGDTQQAVQYLSEASRYEGTDSAARARQALARLEIAHQPGRYIQVTPVRDEHGELLLRVVNQAPVAIRDIQIEIAVPSLNARRSLTISEALRSGRGTTLKTGIGSLPEELNLASAIRGGVRSASVID
ncbi:MAG: M48 family metalloprotease [Verrucomicrobiota bacterium]